MSIDTTDLALWLTAQLDEDTRILHEANTSPEMVTGIPRSYAAAPVALHIAEFASPDRVLREIDAKRKLVRLLTEALEVGEDYKGPDLYDGIEACRAALHLLALPYASREGYRPEWAPTE